jgi:hypothetical protein
MLFPLPFIVSDVHGYLWGIDSADKRPLAPNGSARTNESCIGSTRPMQESEHARTLLLFSL